MTSESEFYAARKREDSFIYASRYAPRSNVTSRRTAKQGGKPVWLKGSKVVDMNFRPIYPPAKGK